MKQQNTEQVSYKQYK